MLLLLQGVLAARRRALIGFPVILCNYDEADEDGSGGAAGKRPRPPASMPKMPKDLDGGGAPPPTLSAAVPWSTTVGRRWHGLAYRPLPPSRRREATPVEVASKPLTSVPLSVGGSSTRARECTAARRLRRYLGNPSRAMARWVVLLAARRMVARHAGATQ